MAREAELIDWLVDQLLALEPIEHKQHRVAGTRLAGGSCAAACGEPAAPEAATDHAEGLAPEGGERESPNPEAADTEAAGPAGAAGGAGSDSTMRMLRQMRAVLDREAARLGIDGAEGKAAVDQVALIARTLEKIDQMEHQIAADRAGETARTLSADERAEMRRTVRHLILAAAERLAAERLAAAEHAPDEDAPVE
ncbi:hypothetical protein AWJ14_14840 [Hoeflea olei]|uniref:Uncharacterized protein n=2 Tax=Hoeflea olei TaxID=1480615 RepID=A0A1C1YQW2_9HYPH|nr:hypothetical protein AWJ14_14840 [Hoeflea olei]